MFVDNFVRYPCILADIAHGTGLIDFHGRGFRIFREKGDNASCGFAVPLFDLKGERDTLAKWATKRGDEGVSHYWADRNQISLDGKPTNILDL